MSNNPPAKAATRAAAPVQMEHVARLAGVSMMTVSRAIREPGKVATATRERVEAAIAKIGYVPNLTAGSLASNRSHIVAAIVPTIDNSIFAETMRGLTETLAAGGYQLLLGQTGYDEHAEEALVAAFLGRRVDGMVITGVSHSALTRQRLARAGIPVVETWDLTPDPIDMVVGFSNRDAGRAIARYLLEKGHRRLGFAGGGDDRTRSRLAGFEAAIRRVKGACLTRVLMPAGTSFRGGRTAVGELLAQDPKLQAIFCSNDALAVGALMECHRRGIHVPDELAIAGFADLDIAAEVEPALTSVQVRSRTIGEDAANMLLARLRGDTITAAVRDLGFTVVPRASA